MWGNDGGSMEGVRVIMLQIGIDWTALPQAPAAEMTWHRLNEAKAHSTSNLRKL